MKYKELGWFGVGIKYFNYGTFEYTDENGVTDGSTFGANDLMFSVGYSNYMYEVINYGVTAKFIYSNIADYNSTAVAFDFGLLYQIPSEMINIALCFNNVGQQIDSYADTRERLPLDIRAGFSKKLEHLPLRLSISLSDLNEKQEKFIQHFKALSIGGEFIFSDSVNVRIGYNNQNRQDMKLGTTLGISGFSAGIGIKFLDQLLALRLWESFPLMDIAPWRKGAMITAGLFAQWLRIQFIGLPLRDAYDPKSGQFAMPFPGQDQRLQI